MQRESIRRACETLVYRRREKMVLQLPNAFTQTASTMRERPWSSGDGHSSAGALTVSMYTNATIPTCLSEKARTYFCGSRDWA